MAGELDFLQQLYSNPLLGGGFLGSSPSFTPGYGFNANAIMPGVQAAMTGLTGVGATAGKAATDVAAGAAEGASAFSKALPFLNLGITGFSIIQSLTEAGKAADAQRAIQRENERKMEEAKKLLAQNEYEKVRVPVEAYDRAFREGTAANQQAIQALAQDPRMLLGGIQGVQESTIEGQAKTREALADRLFNQAMTQAGAKMAINKSLAGLNLDEVKGGQIAAMAAEKAKIAQQQAAMQGVGNLITQGAGMVGTYGGFATPEDKLALANLKSGMQGTSFTKPETNFMQTLSQNPEMLKALMQIYSSQQGTSTIG